MKRDKEEFKAKNREESFIKDKRPDIQLGRHAENQQERQQVSTSKKNRMYQARQAPEQIAIQSETPYTSDMQIDFSKQAEESQPEQTADETQDFSEYAESVQAESYSDTQNSEPPKRTATKKNQLYQKHSKGAQKPIDTDILQGVNHSKAQDYNIRDVVRDNKTEFTRNTDMDFSETAEVKDSNKRIDNLQLTIDDSSKESGSKLKQRKQVIVNSQSSIVNNDAEQAASADVPFDRVKRFEEKAEKARAKADKAEQKLPHKKKIKKQRVFDEEKQKPKNRLQFEKEIKPQGDPYHRTPLAPVKSAVSVSKYETVNKIHSKIAEVEHENTAVEATHKTEQKAETLARYSVRTAKYIDAQRKAAPYQKAARLRHRAEKAEIKAIHEKTIAENPQLKKSVLKKFQQKQRIKKQYQKAKRAQQTAKTAKKTAQNTERTLRRFVAFVWRHKAIFGVVLAVALLIAWLGTALSSCSVMMTTGFNSVMVSSYFAEDADIYAAEDYYISLEQDLQAKINRIESDYAGYDEYSYNLAQIGHNPYELISYLTAVYQDFKFNDIKGALDTLFNSQYHLRITETAETRTDEDGNESEYRILNVTLTNSGMTQSLTDEQKELYGIYLASKGNRDYLFADDIYANESESPGYVIPGEALTDETFRRLITEAEKYLGYPYVWGGSTPATSFDCSGFVCWVFKNSGVYPLHRTTAQGIYDQCTRISPQDAKPGDLIFFKGTYNTSEVSHIGIYVGGGMMIHCGNPIQYASVNTNYWTSHFYAYGRLGGS